ncbi:MAG: YdcH family protein [Deltaproteobacteria bacterium]|nr:YdcH family protein [Deltaproteobacteria bacterium]
MVTDKSRSQGDIDRLRREHRALDEQIIALESRRFLSSTEETEIKRLKRLKLHKKDEIAALSTARD